MSDMLKQVYAQITTKREPAKKGKAMKGTFVIGPEAANQRLSSRCNLQDIMYVYYVYVYIYIHRYALDTYIPISTLPKHAYTVTCQWTGNRLLETLYLYLPFEHQFPKENTFRLID